jgi:hypothetical protein
MPTYRRKGGGWLVVLWLAACGSARAADPSALDALLARFQPEGPTVLLQHRLGYRFLNMELKYLGDSRLRVSAGQWQNRATGKAEPAALLELAVDSRDAGKAGARRRVSVHNRIVALVRLPDLELLVYGKYAEEYFHPVFGRETRIHELCLYSFESGSLDYDWTDYLSGTTCTNLAAGGPDLVEQSRQIRPLMDLLLDVYGGKRAPIRRNDQVSVRFNVGGRAVPLAVAARKGRSPGCFKGPAVSALHLEVGPARDRTAKANRFDAWLVPFAEAVAGRDDSALAMAAKEAVVRSMVPLTVDYDLPVGTLRASLESLSATNTLTGTPGGGKQPTR